MKLLFTVRLFNTRLHIKGNRSNFAAIIQEVTIVKKIISTTQRNAIANGLICLKGGDVSTETAPFRRIVEIEEISDWFDGEWFKGKHLIYLPL